jgi:hypothetical protein
VRSIQLGGSGMRQALIEAPPTMSTLPSFAVSCWILL